MNNETIILYGFIRHLASMAEKAETGEDIARLKETAAAFGAQAEILLDGADESEYEDCGEMPADDFIDTMWTLIAKSKAVTAEMEALLAEFDGELAALCGEADE